MKGAAVLWLALLLSACAPDRGKRFDASCGNNLNCMAWYVTDVCNDGLAVDFNFFALKEAGKTWGPYQTSTPGVYVNGLLDCQQGESVCIGAYSGGRQWGLGAGGDASCADCCGVCNGMSFRFYFTCGAGREPA